MQVDDLPLSGLKLITLKMHGDERGFFVERYHRERFAQAGITEHFVQDNHSRSAPKILRGLHYQFDKPQGKLVGASMGRIWDVAVDIRHNSPTYGQSYGVELSDMNAKLLWIPAGFAHGFCVLGEQPADVYYKCTAMYNPTGEGGIRFDDVDLNIDWPVQNPIISERDKVQQSFAEYRKAPAW
jgi:dTDP-4-dehydrorhamnose 3,5-epimerase